MSTRHCDDEDDHDDHDDRDDVGMGSHARGVYVPIW